MQSITHNRVYCRRVVPITQIGGGSNQKHFDTLHDLKKLMKGNDVTPEIQFDSTSGVPKYHQVVNLIVKDIEGGRLSVGDRLPSINEFSEQYYLSRDTVEKAYAFLKTKQIITSIKGKGYYVNAAHASAGTL